MMGLHCLITAFAAFGCFAIVSGLVGLNGAQLAAGTVSLALVNEDLRFKVEDVGLPGQEANVESIVALLNELTANNSRPFSVEGKLTQAQQYGFLNALCSLASSEKELAHQSIVKRAYFTSGNATAAWLAYFRTIPKARQERKAILLLSPLSLTAVQMLESTVDGFAAEVAPAAKIISASLVSTVNAAIAAYGG